MGKIILSILFLSLTVIQGCGLNNAGQDNSFYILPDTEIKVEHFPGQEWKSISPEKAGLNPIFIEEINGLMESEDNLHSFILTRRGYIISEKYYEGYDKDRLNNVKSVTKSITSLLTGIAIDRGIIKSTGERLDELFPHYFNENTDPDKAGITLKELLTMTAGLKWNNNGGIIKSQWWEHRTEPNKYAFNASTLTGKPGLEFNYNSSLSHMIAEAISIRSGKKVLDFARENLFDPLNIKNVEWETDKTGLHRGNSELWMTPRDMAKIGLLILAGGSWNGRQIVSRSWIQESIDPKVKAISEYGKYGNYGYQWWSKEFRNHSIYFAAGFGGQLIIIIPDYDIVAVTTSDWTIKNNSFKGLEIIEDYLKNN